MHTNNYTEAWHQVLNSWYIPPPEKKRIDELVKILCNKAEPHYRSTLSCVEGGFLTQGVSKFQRDSKTTAYSHTPQILEFLGITVTIFPNYVSALLDSIATRS